MKIVTVCLDLSPSHGGMYRAVVDVATMLNASIVTFRDGSGEQPCDALSVPVNVIHCEGLSLLRRAVWPPQQIIQAASDAVSGADLIVVHSLFRAHALIVHRIARAAAIPYISVPHGALDPGLWKSKQWARRAWMALGGTRFLRDAAHVVFATDTERERAIETLGWEPRSKMIPFPVPVDRSSPSCRQARAKLALPGERRLVLVLGRLAREKRPHEIVAAFCEADPQGCDLVLAGPEGDVSVAALRALVPERMQSRIWFTGPLDDAARNMVIAACDVSLSWSLHESFGYATAEAMAAGKPVILSPGNVLHRDPSWPECGIFPSGSERESLVAALRQAAAWTNSEIQILGERARTWVSQRLDPLVVADQWMDVGKLPVK